MTSLEKTKCVKLANDIANVLNLNAPLYDAFCTINRAEFTPIIAHAYTLDAQPILANQWISSPLTVAKITLALDINENTDSILEIGCGTGYQAAILSKLVRRVFTIERIERLANEAKNHFLNLNIANINVRYDDGNNGWKTYAPYDRILLSASAKNINHKLFDQLANGGILVAPMGNDEKQFITKFTKDKNGLIRKEILDECSFVPLLDGLN